MAQNPYQPYSAYQQAPQYGPYQNMYMWPGQPMQAQMPAYGSQTPNTGIQKPPAMSGRVVSQEAEITPQEVPMDGSFSWFPMADGSAVIGKRWNSDGTITTLRYVMASDPEPEKQLTVEDVNKLIDMRLASIGGEPIPETTMANSIGTAGDPENASTAALVGTHGCCCGRLSVVNTGTEPAIINANPSLIVRKVC